MHISCSVTPKLLNNSPQLKVSRTKPNFISSILDHRLCPGNYPVLWQHPLNVAKACHSALLRHFVTQREPTEKSDESIFTGTLNTSVPNPCPFDVVTPVPIVTAKPAGDSIARAKDVPSASAGPEILAAPELAVLHALPDCHLPVHTRVVVEWTPSATFWVVKARSSRSLCNGPKTVSFQTLSTSTNRVEALIHADSSYLVMCVKCWKE